MSWLRSARPTTSARRAARPGGVIGLVALSLAWLGGGTPTAAASTPQPVVSGYGRGIRFSGYDWLAKTSSVLVGPGPNYFSDAPQQVWTDDQGRLHLRIAQDGAGRWYAAEVVLQASLGYGSYQFRVATPASMLDPNVVLGLFTWNDDPAENHREMDIELARWGDPDAPNGQYSVQPHEQAGNVFLFAQPLPGAPTTHRLDWQPGRASFASWLGQDSSSSEAGALVASHTFTQAIPDPGGEQVRINLWLDRGRPPTNLQAAEVVIDRFEFCAACAAAEAANGG